MAKLRWVQALTAGVETWLALPDLPPHLTLTCARGTHRDVDAGEHPRRVFHLAKPYAAIVEDRKQHRWTRRMALPLNGQTLGILGLGEIGQEVARLATALRMRVIGTKRRAAPLPNVAEVFSPERTDEVLAQSDFVLLLLPATPETENFINAERLAKMKPAACLLNFGRGHLIADADLIAAVQQKRIAGAVLDVFRQEPLPADHPFWGTDGYHRAAAYRRRPSDPRQDRGAVVRGESGAVPRWATAEGSGGSRRGLLMPAVSCGADELQPAENAAFAGSPNFP